MSFKRVRAAKSGRGFGAGQAFPVRAAAPDPSAATNPPAAAAALAHDAVPHWQQQPSSSKRAHAIILAAAGIVRTAVHLISSESRMVISPAPWQQQIMLAQREA